MKPKLLSKAEFKKTLVGPMTRYDGPALLDIWPYVDSVPATHLEGHAVYEQFVECVYRTADERHHHVLVMTRTKNVFLVVIVDIAAASIVGHSVLDLNREYGLR